MIFLFYGPNSFALRRKLRQMVEAYIKKTGSDFGLERIDGAEVDFENLRTNLAAVPMLSTSRLVIIEGLSASKAAEKVDRLIKIVPETTVAVLVEPGLEQRSVFYKTLAKSAKLAKFDNLSRPQLAAWARQEIKRYGGEIDAPALQQLLDAVADDQWRLHQEILKLVNYSPKITPSAVKELVEPGFYQTIFDLVEAIVARRSRRALEVYRGLLGSKANELYILTMITWQLRNLLLAKTAGRVTPAELAEATGMSPYAAGKALASAGRFEEEDLKAAFLATLETDYAIKSGEGEAEILIERLILQLAA